MHKSKILTANDLVLFPATDRKFALRAAIFTFARRIKHRLFRGVSVLFIYSSYRTVYDTVLPDHHPIRVDHINDFEEDPRKMAFLVFLSIPGQRLRL